MKARLNFVDHPDSTFSCNAIFFGEYNPQSRAHNACRILAAYIEEQREKPPEYIHLLHEVEVSRPELETQAFMLFQDEGEAIRFNLQYLPDKGKQESSFKPESPAHAAANLAHCKMESVFMAVSDAIMTQSDRTVVVKRDKINTLNGHE